MLKCITAALAVGLALSGCAGYSSWDPATTVDVKVKEPDVVVAVTHVGGNRYDAVHRARIGAPMDGLTMKHNLIYAVEHVSGCKVVEAEYMSAGHYLNTIVRC